MRRKRGKPFQCLIKRGLLCSLTSGENTGGPAEKALQTRSPPSAETLAPTSYWTAWADIQHWSQDWQKPHKTIRYTQATRGSDSRGHKHGFCSEIPGVTVGSAYNLYNEHPVPAWPLVRFSPFLLNDCLGQSCSFGNKIVLQNWLMYIDIAGGNIFTQPQRAAAQLSLLLACALLKWRQT